MDKIEVNFYGGISRYSDEGCNYMIGHYTDEDGDEQELYSEVIVPSELDENKAEGYGYAELKADIIRQAKEAGIDENDLDIFNY